MLTQVGLIGANLAFSEAAVDDTDTFELHNRIESRVLTVCDLETRHETQNLEPQSS